MTYGADSIVGEAKIVIWQDPRNRVCIAIGDGQPVSLTRDGAKFMHNMMLKACQVAVQKADAGDVTCATVWEQGPFRVGYDTRSRFHNKKTREQGPRVPMLSLSIHGVDAVIHAGDGAAVAHRLGRYAARPYVRKTVTHDGV